MSWKLKRPGLIPSLDVPLSDLPKLLMNIDDLKMNNRNPIYALKIGALLEQDGLKKVISIIREYSELPIILDHQKLADIPSIIEKFVEKIASFGIDGAILLGYVGPRSIQTFVHSCQDHGLANYIVAEMSHEGASEYIKSETPLRITQLALDLQSTGVVCPATKPESILKCRDILHGSKLGIMSPGHGPQGGGADSAVEAGADWIVIGRSFYTSPTPQEILIKIGRQVFDKWQTRSR
ncbi:MAG: orotidine 5'-phosphate decarboxylase / HUMPS family protein [Candidatus Helarchaeota archaeon]